MGSNSDWDSAVWQPVRRAALGSCPLPLAASNLAAEPSKCRRREPGRSGLATPGLPARACQPSDAYACGLRIVGSWPFRWTPAALRPPVLLLRRPAQLAEPVGLNRIPECTSRAMRALRRRRLYRRANLPSPRSALRCSGYAQAEVRAPFTNSAFCWRSRDGYREFPGNFV